MKRMTWLAGVMAVALATGLAGGGVDAKRLGGGGSSGMQRSLPAKPAPQGTPAQQAAPQQAGAPAAAAAPVAGAATAAAAQGARRSWMGPIAGIAAGLGIAALMSHFGMGAAFGEFLTMALLAVVAVVVIGFLMRRFAGNRQPQGLQAAGAGAGFGAAPTGAASTPWSMQRSAQPAPAAADWGRPTGATAPSAALATVDAAPRESLPLPANFDREAFERVAKLIFIRMQAANDAANLDDLRQFTTPQMFAAARLDLHNRGGNAQKTDVVQLQAEVLELAQDGGQDVVSVRYHGLIREDDAGNTTQPFDEVWHLVRPTDSDSPAWSVAGIQQSQAH